MDKEQARKEFEKAFADLVAKVKERGLTNEELLEVVRKEIPAEIERRNSLN
jgi:hypothetical protein